MRRTRRHCLLHVSLQSLKATRWRKCLLTTRYCTDIVSTGNRQLPSLKVPSPCRSPIAIQIRKSDSWGVGLRQSHGHRQRKWPATARRDPRTGLMSASGSTRRPVAKVRPSPRPRGGDPVLRIAGQSRFGAAINWPYGQFQHLNYRPGLTVVVSLETERANGNVNDGTNWNWHLQTSNALLLRASGMPCHDLTVVVPNSRNGCCRRQVNS